MSAPLPEVFAATFVRPLGMSQDQWDAVCAHGWSCSQRFVMGVDPQDTPPEATTANLRASDTEGVPE